MMNRQTAERIVRAMDSLTTHARESDSEQSLADRDRIRARYIELRGKGFDFASTEARVEFLLSLECPADAKRSTRQS